MVLGPPVRPGPKGNFPGGSVGGGTPRGGGEPGVYDPTLSGPPSPAVVNSIRQVQEFVEFQAVQPGAALATILGRRRVQGSIVYGTAGSPQLLIAMLAAGPNNALKKLYLNDQEVTNGSDGVSWTAYLGSYSQSVDTTVLSVIGNFRFPGTAYVVISIDGGDSFHDPSPFFGQVRTVSADFEGVLFYDPRENRLIHSEDFSSARWSSSPGNPTLATGQPDIRFNGTAASKWTFGGSGPYTISRTTSGLSLTTADPVTVAIDIRTTSGTIPNVTLTAAKTVGGASASTTFTVTTSPRRRYVTLPAGAGTGNAKIQLSGIPSGAVLIVAFASLQIRDQDYGYIATTTTAITAGSRYNPNPVLALLMLETDSVNGWGGTDLMTGTNLAKWGLAAELCDGIQADGSATFSLGYALTQDGDARTYREAIRGMCAAEVYWENGLLCCCVDGYQPRDPALRFSTLAPQTTGVIPAKNDRFWLTSRIDRPTRVVVSFSDVALDYGPNKARGDHPGLRDGSVKEALANYQYDAIVSFPVAQRVARYTEGRPRHCEGNATFTAPYPGILLERGMLIELTTDDLAAQLLLVDGFEISEDGEVTPVCHEYDEALYTYDPFTPDTPIASSVPPLRPAPPIVQAWTPGTGGYTATILVDASHGPRKRYAAGLWSSSGLTSFDASKINDGDTDAAAAVFAAAGTQRIQLDLGAGVSAAFTRVDCGATATCGVSPTIEYSDDGSSWTAATAGASRYEIAPENASVSNNLGFVKVWDSVSDHRYWRLSLTGIGSAFSFTEVQFLESIAGGNLQGGVREIRIKSGLGLDSPTWKTLAVAPLMGTFLIDVTPILARTQSPGSTDSLVTIDAVIDCAFENTIRSGYSFKLHRFATFAPSGIGTAGAHVVAQDVATGPDPQSGSLAIDGTASVGRLEAGGTRIESDGSLMTDESARVPPWIEASVDCSVQTGITSTSATDITGATVTFTPPADCRVKVTGVFDVRMDTTGSIFVGELKVNGGAQGRQAIWGPQTANDRGTVSQVWSVVLTGGVAYTIKLTGRLDAGSGTFTTFNPHTGFVIAGVGRF